MDLANGGQVSNQFFGVVETVTILPADMAHSLLADELQGLACLRPRNSLWPAIR